MGTLFSPNGSAYLGSCLEGLLFGFYSGIFVLYLRMACKKGTDNVTRNIVFYALCVLYMFSAALIAIDIVLIWAHLFQLEGEISEFFIVAQPIIFATCDFIAQIILIYRCWIVWDRNVRVVIIPSIFAFVFFVLWISGSVIAFKNRDGPGTILVALPSRSVDIHNALALTSFTASMTVNAIVTGLVVFKIFKIFREVKRHYITKSLVGDGRKLRSVMFVIIESGMALLSIQLARLILSIYPLYTIPAANDLYQLTVHVHEMLNGIIPTLILVRVSMGLSFYDEPSLAESTSSMQFAAHNPNLIPGTTSISQDAGSR